MLKLIKIIFILALMGLCFVAGTKFGDLNLSKLQIKTLGTDSLESNAEDNAFKTEEIGEENGGNAINENLDNQSTGITEGLGGVENVGDENALPINETEVENNGESTSIEDANAGDVNIDGVNNTDVSTVAPAEATETTNVDNTTDNNTQEVK